MTQTVDAVVELEQAIRAIDHPAVAAVASWDVRVDEDWSGEPTVFVRVTFKDAAIRAAWPSRNALRVEIMRCSSALFPDRPTYVEFSAQSIAMDPEPPALRRHIARR